MEEHIEKLNKRLIQSMNESYPIGLASGKMGISIYYYHLSRIEKDEQYKLIADQLLDDILGQLSFDLSISVENGLAGVALGITYLIRANYVKGDINELLEHIDNVIFRRLAFFQSNLSNKEEELLHLLFFLYIRLTDQTDEGSIYIFRELIIKVLNIFASQLKEDFFEESFSFSVYDYDLPLFLYVCASLLKLNFYNNRIYKLLEEFEFKILSRFPVLHANRLYLLCSILPLVPYMQNKRWEYYVDLLQREINLQDILYKEMKNKSIFVSNGLSMIYLLLHYLEKNYPENKISYNPQVIYEKIIASDAWESLSKHDYFYNIHSGLLNGFPGVLLILSHIQKQNT